MELLFSLFLIFVIYKIVSVDNAVNAALFLILLAITFSMFLFYFGVNFLAILYLAVYIGAVAVFFLFVVMMTDLNSFDFTKVKVISLSFFLVSLILGFLITILIIFLVFNTNNFNNFSVDLFNSNIEIIGLYIFREHSGPFVLISLIILVALIGSIFITFNSDDIDVYSINNRSQDMEVQLARNTLTSVNLFNNS